MWPLIKLLPMKTNFQFVRFAKLAAVISIVGILASLGRAMFPFEPPCGGLNCGIDFTGGTMIELSTAPKQVDLAAARAAVNALNVGDPQVQGVGDGTKAMVRYQPPAGASADKVGDEVRAALTKALGQVSFESPNVIGAKVSGELFQSGLMALGLAILLMMVYIWFRFELQFGIGAVVALFHDVILTFGIIAFFQLEFSLNTVAAVLTVIGYSMNDTVVVFDRLRENLRKYKRMPLRELIDLSINETLSRTVITGLTAVLALTGLAVFGGSTLLDMSLVLIFGIVIGTYSSIYVAAPVLLLFGVKRGQEEAEPLKPPASART
ncbi:protein translocase subunit SecF [Phenylobacterium sp. VNQ135]|uniref:protein translocase subunit SecF n=1 Tax=Phenylobacterium sp. VNQ135 TaxID=3400922 RepID=UPI003BFAC48D